jgi:hypothetical protein
MREVTLRNWNQTFALTALFVAAGGVGAAPSGKSVASGTKVRATHAPSHRGTLREEKPQGTPSLRLAPGKPYSIFAPGTEVTFTTEALRTDAGNLTLAWEARDLADRTVARGESRFTGNPLTIRFTPREPGILYVWAELRDETGKVVTQTDTRAAIFTPRKTPVAETPIVWAVSAHLGGLSPRDLAREVEIMRMTGFAACRFDLTWSRVQPEANVYNWETYDRIFAEFVRNGVRPLPLIAYGTKWATTGDPNAKDWHEWHNAPPRTDAYTGFLRSVVGRYGKYTKYWEIWNEPDIAFWLGTAEQYAELFNASVQTIRAADPQAKVMNGGFSETKRRPDFIPQFLSLITSRPDIYAYHSHGPLPNLVRAAEDTQGYLKKAGWDGVAIWLNEAGFSSTRGATEAQQAMALVKKMTYAPAVGATGYVWYDLRNDGTDPNENEHNFGLLRNDFIPKAGLVAANTTMTALEGKRFLKRLDLGQGRYGLLFAKGNEQTLVYWNEAGAADSQESRLLRTGAKSGRTISMMGVSKPEEIKNGLLMTVLTREPRFLTLKGSKINLAPAPATLDAPASIAAAPGARRTVAITVTNPMSAPLNGSLALSVPTGWRVSPERIPVALAGGQEKRLSVEIIAPIAPTSGSLQLRLTSSALPQPAEAAAALLPAKVAPRVLADAKDANLFSLLAPMATLSGRESTVSLFEATPMRELHFAGPEDISAQVFLGHNEHAILLGIRVRDDKHVQNESPGELWKGDSVQFAVFTPGGQHYEWTAALTASGPRLALGIAPEGTPRGEASSDTVAIRREGDTTSYLIRIPDTLPGIREMLAQGGAINVIANDNDGQGRKGWIEWAPGIGRTKDPAPFPRIVFTGGANTPPAR